VSAPRQPVGRQRPLAVAALLSTPITTALWACTVVAHGEEGPSRAIKVAVPWTSGNLLAPVAFPMYLGKFKELKRVDCCPALRTLPVDRASNVR
jgi:hypothetical protein